MLLVYENDVVPFYKYVGDAYKLMRPLEKFWTNTKLSVNNFKMKIMLVKTENTYAYRVKKQMSYTILLETKSLPIEIMSMERVVEYMLKVYKSSSR